MQDFKDKKQNVIDMVDYMLNMLNRTNDMFTWEGLPDTTPAWILELYLQTNGNISYDGYNHRFNV